MDDKFRHFWTKPLALSAQTVRNFQQLKMNAYVDVRIKMEFKKGKIILLLGLPLLFLVIGFPLAAASTHGGGITFIFARVLIWPIALINELFPDFWVSIRGNGVYLLFILAQYIGYSPIIFITQKIVSRKE